MFKIILVFLNTVTGESAYGSVNEPFETLASCEAVLEENMADAKAYYNPLLKENWVLDMGFCDDQNPPA